MEAGEGGGGVGRRVVISQAWRREGPPGPAGIAPPRGYHLHFYRSRQPRATKKGKRGTMASFIRPDKDAASFQRRPERERNSSVPKKEGKERKRDGKKESSDWSGERHRKREMPVCGLQSETRGYGHTVTRSVRRDVAYSLMSPHTLGRHRKDMNVAHPGSQKCTLCTTTGQIHLVME